MSPKGHKEESENAKPKPVLLDTEHTEGTQPPAKSRNALIQDQTVLRERRPYWTYKIFYFTLEKSIYLSSLRQYRYVCMYIYNYITNKKCHVIKAHTISP